MWEKHWETLYNIQLNTTCWVVLLPLLETYALLELCLWCMHNPHDPQPKTMLAGSYLHPSKSLISFSIIHQITVSSNLNNAHQLLEEKVLFHVSNSYVNFQCFNTTCAGYSRYENRISAQSISSCFSSNVIFHIKAWLYPHHSCRISFSMECQSQELK